MLTQELNCVLYWMTKFKLPASENGTQNCRVAQLESRLYDFWYKSVGFEP
jgi:hypothetical protein